MSNRRAFLRQAGLATLGVGGLTLAASAGLDLAAARTARAAAAYDYTARSTFDEFDRLFHESDAAGQPDEPNEHGGLAWGQSYVLMGFIRMYDAYRDTHYLDRLIHNVDLMLGTRDSARGVTDYAGRSLPAWRAMHPYTAGSTRLADGSAREVLEVRSAGGYVDAATATVRPSSTGTADRFTLEVANTQFGYVDTFADVSMDPASANYVVRRVYDAYPTQTKTTVRDLRSPGADGGQPVEGVTALASEPVIFAVHTGMVTTPMAAYVRTVYRDPRLRGTPRYKAKADEYLAAVRAAVAVHDAEWHESAGGIGYYQWPKGMPVPYDGTVQPINQSVALASTHAELAVATGRRSDRDRARRLAAMFAGQLAVDADDAAVWPYWPSFSAVFQGYAKTGDVETDLSAYTPSYGTPGSGAQQYEDLSHGAIEIDFATLAHGAGIAFRGVDLARFARTYARNLATTAPDGTATTYVRVDGSGGLATAGQYLQAPRWMAVAPWDDRVFHHSRAVYDDHAVQPGQGSHVLGVANLNWYPRRFG